MRVQLYDEETLKKEAGKLHPNVSASVNGTILTLKHVSTSQLDVELFKVLVNDSVKWLMLPQNPILEAKFCISEQSMREFLEVLAKLR